MKDTDIMVGWLRNLQAEIKAREVSLEDAWYNKRAAEDRIEWVESLLSVLRKQVGEIEEEIKSLNKQGGEVMPDGNEQTDP